MSHDPRRALAWLLLPLSLAIAPACDDDEPAPAAATQTLPPAPACVCEGQEDCRACYEHIGECCYGDATIFGHVAALSANCDRDGKCSSCCNECVTMSCDDLVAGRDCPLGKSAQ